MLTGHKVLVTGGAGFIGSHLCDCLVEAGAQVVVIDDLSVGRACNLSQPLASGRLQLIQASILEPETWQHHLQDCQWVFHLAVVCLRNSFQQPLRVHEVNATGTLALIGACQRVSGLQRFVYVSSSEVYGSAASVPMDEDHPLQPTTIYAASKLAGEWYTRASELPWCIARPFNCYGPREHHQGSSGEVIPRFAVRIANGQSPLIFGDGQQTRDFTWVQDTARGLVNLVAEPQTQGQIINLARGQEVSILTIARLLLKAFARDEVMIEHRTARPCDVRRHYANIARAQRLCNFSPRVGIEQGLRDYVQWFQENYPDPSVLLEEVEEQNW